MLSAAGPPVSTLCDSSVKKNEYYYTQIHIMKVKKSRELPPPWVQKYVAIFKTPESLSSLEAVTITYEPNVTVSDAI